MGDPFALTGEVCERLRRECAKGGGRVLGAGGCPGFPVASPLLPPAESTPPELPGLTWEENLRPPGPPAYCWEREGTDGGGGGWSLGSVSYFPTSHVKYGRDDR